MLNAHVMLGGRKLVLFHKKRLPFFREIDRYTLFVLIRRAVKGASSRHI
jgi:hypothetical protein